MASRSGPTFSLMSVDGSRGSSTWTIPVDQREPDTWLGVRISYIQIIETHGLRLRIRVIFHLLGYWVSWVQVHLSKHVCFRRMCSEHPPHLGRRCPMLSAAFAWWSRSQQDQSGCLESPGITKTMIRVASIWLYNAIIQ